METPVELGLPEHFTGWRHGQGEIVEEIAQSGKHHFLLDAPTGAGKSVIGIATYLKMVHAHRVMQRILGKEELKQRCIYVTRTKQLQDQILAEFPEARTLKGRGNYPCVKHEKDFPDYTAEHCSGAKHCKFLKACPYWMAKEDALLAPIAVLNDAYYLAEINGPGDFTDSEFVILDEVDSIEGALMNFIQFTVTSKQLKAFKIDPPDEPDKPTAWLAWADQVGRSLNTQLNFLQGSLDEVDSDLWSGVQMTLQKQVKKLEFFAQKLRQFLVTVNDSWVFDIEELEFGEFKWTFKPVLVAEYAFRYLWKHSERVLGMSGTIFEPRSLAMEIGLDDYVYKRIPSPFPVAHRPIFFRPVANMTYRTQDEELPKLAAEVDLIIDKYPGEKVLVHTVSYNIRDYLVDELSSTRLITHGQKDREIVLDRFKRSPDPLVMVSPSFDRGVDLKDALCRCVIICKVPFLSMSDQQVKARMKMPGGNEWYLLRALQTIVQMSGRAVRGPNDYCDTWILDKQFQRLRFQMRFIIPKWWQEAIR